MRYDKFVDKCSNMKIVFLFLCLIIISSNAAVLAKLQRTFTWRDDKYTVESLIQLYGYEVETHNVTTSDGYILKLHRIPRANTDKNNGRVAYLAHGLLSSSADWVLAGPGHSLAFALADEGYDVWLANARGNSESRRHVSLDPDKDGDFWSFTWHEVAVIDTPETIDYILNLTNSTKVDYVGHAQGTTIYYAMLSELPAFNSKIRVHVSMSPAAYVDHMTSPLHQIASAWSGTIETIADLIGYHEFLPSDKFIQNLIGDVVCDEDAVSQLICTNAMFAVFGFSREQLNETLLPLLFKYTPAGTSTNQVVHYLQEVKSGDFCQFDYGWLKNMLKYGSISPPSYDLSKITAPTFLIYSTNDWISAVEDVDRTCSAMINGCKGKILVSDKNWNHIDYMYGIDNYKLVYSEILKIFASYE